MKAMKPKHGCARCEWWAHHRHDDFGECYINKMATWWKNGPCDEYELDPDSPDEIELRQCDTPQL